MNISKIKSSYKALNDTEIWRICSEEEKDLWDAAYNRFMGVFDKKNLFIKNALSFKKTNKVPVKIVNTGLVSSGKSSLFNILIDRIDNERFKTGAARTTVAQDYEDMGNGIYLIDTPGIDVRDEDDEVAFKSLLEADIVVMIHNIKTGMPNRQEIEWLKRICDAINNREELKKRLVFVCSWIDERDTDDDYGNVISNTKEMVNETAGVEVDFFEVSAKRYISGYNKKNSKLMELSNITTLKQALVKKAKDYRDIAEQTAMRTMLDLCAENRKLLVKEKKKKEKELENKVKKIKDKNQKKLSSWYNVCEQMKMYIEEIIDLRREL